MARKLLGRRNATMNASDAGPAPSTAAISTSRMNPATRESAVKPPTEASRPIIRTFYASGMFQSVNFPATPPFLLGNSFLGGHSNAARFRLLYQALGRGLYPLHNRIHARGIGMEPVRLDQRAIERHAFEKERIEQHVVFLCELREDLIVISRIARSEIARRLHAGE